MEKSHTLKTARGRLAGCCFGLMLALHAGSAAAISLQDAYQAALKHDPTFRMHYFENEAGKESRILGRSLLLPNVVGSYSKTKNETDLTQRQGNRVIVTHPDYTGSSAVVQVRQPLFNLEAWARYRHGVAQTKESAARFETHKDDVAVRVLGAYVDVLFATDRINLVKAERSAFVEHMKVTKRLFEEGEGTKTDMLEVQARLDVVEAKLLEAQDELATARNTLEGVIGMPFDSVDSLKPEFRVDPLIPGSFEAWRDLALNNNPDLKAAKLSIEVAQQEVNRARAGHAPRLDLVASYGKNDSESITTLGQEAVTKSVGIQLNVPIYSGGQVSAGARQAVALRERAKADLDRRTSLVMVELRKAHNIALSSVAKVDALVKAVGSGNLLITATEQSIKGGVRINLDLLNSQQHLAETQRDLAQARYSYLLGLLRLKAASGLLTDEDVFKVAKYFE